MCNTRVKGESSDSLPETRVQQCADSTLFRECPLSRNTSKWADYKQLHADTNTSPAYAEGVDIFQKMIKTNHIWNISSNSATHYWWDPRCFPQLDLRGVFLTEEIK